MQKENWKVWIFRSTAFVWSLSLVLLFRYTLDRLYPFWSDQISLSFFAYLLVFLIWVAYTLITISDRKTNLIRPGFLVLTILNMVTFFSLFIQMGELRYLYQSPALYTFQVFLFFFTFSSKLGIILPHQVSMALGAITGFLASTLIGAHWGVLPLALFVYLIPLHLLGKGVKPRLGSKERMLPLRVPFDFIRYLLLGLSLLAVLDTHRHRFYIILALLVVGPIFQFIALYVDKAKHHIKYGIRALGVIFVLIAFAYQSMPLSYWAAAGYSALTIWEALYFKKAVSGFSRREQAMSGAALLVVLTLHFVSPGWHLILVGILLIFTQSGLLVYLFKKHRPWISALFMMSISVWTVVVAIRYQDSYRREFWQPASISIPEPAPLAWLISFDDKPHIYTNLYPKEILDHVDRFSYFSAPSTTIAKAIIEKETGPKGKQEAVVLYNTDGQKPYHSEQGQNFLREYLTQKKTYWVYLYSLKSPDTCWTFTRGDQIAPIRKSADKSLTPQQETLLFKTGLALASWYREQSRYEYALRVYNDMLTFFQHETLYRKIAEINGILQNTPEQVRYLEMLIDSGKATIEEEVLLMELYFYTEQPERSRTIAETLLQTDQKNRIDYLEWIFKISKVTGDRWEWQKLYRTVEQWKKFDKERVDVGDEVRYEALLANIRDLIESNPLPYDVSAQEKKRQEKIRLNE